jgi:hypothetical protein
LTFHLDLPKGRVLLEVPAPVDDGDEVGRYLYAEGLTGGLGSNPVGLDRGQLGPTRLIAIRRVGGRMLIEQPNLDYRARSDHPGERRAVRESFATSILWAAEPIARDGAGRWLVDITSFLVRDAHGVGARLEAAGQGSYQLDPKRSVVDPAACLAFPDNVEFEALLTYSGTEPGDEVRSVTPSPDSITLIQHHSLIRLPDTDYRPRRFDPRAGSFAVSFFDYAAPLDAPLERRWIVRHRLEKADPRAARSPVKTPIVYYVDPGAPEPVRSALIEGASWWARAFDEAGFIDGFRVELLPEGAHPLDVRYNVIEWVHRATRGWSYGGGLVDPRTGERVKGHVSLGSLRVRQDRLLFEALAGTARTGGGSADDPVRLALARLRPLAAPEVGHTLGLTHNFAASTYAGRASVMDYPAPRIRVGADGELDFSKAYAVGAGAWDVHAIRYAYSEFAPEADEATELESIIDQGIRDGLRFLSDQDARPGGAAHPLANLWDNGSDPVEELALVLDVRRVALSRFGPGNVAPGTPLALLEEALVPLFFSHRYQLTAAAKSIGGIEYDYAVRGDGRPPVTPVSAARQRRALQLVLSAMAPEILHIRDETVRLLYPRPFGYSTNREMFRGATRPAFDALGAAATAAGLVVDELLQPERCARLIQQHDRADDLPALAEVLDALAAKVLDPGEGGTAALRNVVRDTVVDGLIGLVSDNATTAAVRSETGRVLRELGEGLSRAAGGNQRPDVRAHLQFLADRIQRYVRRPHAPVDPAAAPPDPPPGSPIGLVPPAAVGCGSMSDDLRIAP